MAFFESLEVVEKNIIPDMEKYLRQFFVPNAKFRYRYNHGVSDNHTNNTPNISVSIGGESNKCYEYIVFDLTQYPGNCGILISHNMVISRGLKGKGIGQKLLEYKEKIAKELGFSFIRCTTVENNAVEIHILKKFNWLPIRKFLNNRTGNWCIEWEKRL